MDCRYRSWQAFSASFRVSGRAIPLGTAIPRAKPRNTVAVKSSFFMRFLPSDWWGSGKRPIFILKLTRKKAKPYSDDFRKSEVGENLSRPGSDPFFICPNKPLGNSRHDL